MGVLRQYSKASWCESAVLRPTSKFRIDRLLFESSQIGVTGRMLRYLIAGGIATLSYVVLVTLQVELLNFHPVLAICTALLSTEIFVYLVNRLWVYGSSLKHTLAIPRFLVVTVLGLMVNT